MQYIYNGWNNLPRFVALSAILHILIIGAAAYFASITPLKKYITPVYTVDLLGPIAEKPKEADIKPAQEAKPSAVEEPKPLIKPNEIEKPIKTEKPKTAKIEKAIPLKKEKVIETKEKADIDIAVKRIKEKVKKEEDDEASLQKSIIEVEKEANIQKRIEALKKEIEKRESAAKHLVEIKSSAKGIETASKITGNITQELIELEFNAYYSRLWEAIQSQWAFPNDSKRDLMAIISIKISRAGNLMEKWIEKPSGSAAFDNSAIRAIEKAAPF
ncbi:MAG: TonB C-terminal domain-containing protein, partial [Deltaproteobacteria bacterium]|nr:TonB C-terminal domain-containing protein [Deltaproteobacteria bacterium]